MAQNSTTYYMNIEGNLVGRIKEIGAGFNNAATASGRMSGALKGVALRFVGLQALLTMGTKAIRDMTEWIKKSVQEFRTFEKSMAEVSTILTGLGTNIMPAVTANVEMLSVKFGQSADDLARGMYDILSAAFTAESGMKLLETATKASIAGLSDVSTSVDVFTSILNAWGKSAEQASFISDELFQTVVRGKLRYEDLASAMGYIAPIAANLGVEFKEVAAALSTVTRQGQHVDMATRGLSLMIQNIADISPQAAKAAKQFGVDLSATALRVGGLEYVIKDLNDAMKEHGNDILPQMIRNMRSLRVAMALVGDVGIAGYITDLELLENAHGRTEDAMAKMANTSQMQVDILQRSMEKLERSIGESWSDFDIWTKKAKLWWGTFLSGGDADQAIENFEGRTREIRKAMLGVYEDSKYMETQTSISEILSNTDLTQFDTLEQKTAALTENLKASFDPARINEYFINMGKIEQKANLISAVDLKILKTEVLKDEWDEAVAKYGIGEIPAEEITRLNEKAFAEGFAAIDFGKMTRKDVSWGGFFDFLFANTFSDALETTLTSQGTKTLGKIIEGMGANTEIWKAELEALTRVTSTLRNDEEALKGSIDNASEAMMNHQDNIVTLKNSISSLNLDVTDLYVTLGGSKFQGKDYWQAAVVGFETGLDRFQHFSQMAIKYGDDMKTNYMANIKDIASGFEHLDLSDVEGVDWLDSDVWNLITANNDYNGSMLDVIDTMSDYTAAIKEIKKAEEELQKVMDESRKILQQLELERLKIQLKGMMRRRGATRTEEKKLKKIQIEATKERIRMMEEQATAQEEYDTQMVDDLENTYTKAKDLYDEYIDRMKFKLWELQDTRDSDLQDFFETIDLKEDRLIKYGNLYKEELVSLQNAVASHNALMTLIASNPELEANYRQIYGLNAMEQATNVNTQYQEFLDTHGIPGTAPAITPPFTMPTEPEPEQFTAIRNRKSNHFGIGVVTSSSGKSRFWSIPAKINLDLRDVVAGDPLPFKRGTHYVPEDNYYKLHRGERVIPDGANFNSGGNKINIIVNAAVTSDYDVERLAAKLGETINSKLSSRQGTTKYRMR